MMWDGVKPALTTSAAATAWWMALHPPPQKTNRILPYLVEGLSGIQRLLDTNFTGERPERIQCDEDV